MPHDRVERCMRYVTAVEKDEKRAEKAKKARFDALLLERWQAWQEAKTGGRSCRDSAGWKLSRILS